jgi:hypothetical protein
MIPRIAVALLLTGLLCQPATASEYEPLSPSVVLVLKLVATDRVQPATGVVVSDDGLVLVPGDFVTTPAEIIVLDGGADIATNGRPATVYAQAPDTGLAILSVAGLKRPGIILSETDDLYAKGSRFQAFPPAHQIAAGATPLNIPMAPGTDLPYLSGAIFDRCGYLSGMTLAIGLQRPVPGHAPLIFDRGVVRDSFESLQVSVPRATCLLPPDEPEASEVQLPTTQPEAPATDSAPADEVDMEPAPSPGPSANTIEPEPQPSVTPDPGPSGNVVPWWAKFAGLVVLVVLALGIFKRRQRPGIGIDPASDEPDTVQLSTGRDDSAPLPRSGRKEGDLPDQAGLPDGCDGLVVLEGRTGDEREIRHFCAVNTNQFDVVIGRGETDIRIEQATISRRHARLQRHAGNMTLEDLGSSNGSHVNGVPCLHGEVMHLEPGQEICLGDIRLFVRLVHREVEES